MTYPKLSARILKCVAALPLRDGMRVLEIGCGPGVAARAVARRIGNGFVLAIDRSQKAIDLAVRGSADEIAAGLLQFRTVSAENFTLVAGEAKFDLAFAMRVGALDGRHPEAGQKAITCLRSVLVPGGKLYVDTGDPWDVVRF